MYLRSGKIYLQDNWLLKPPKSTENEINFLKYSLKANLYYYLWKSSEIKN